MEEPAAAEENRLSLLDVVIDEYNVEKHMRASRLLLTAEFADGVSLEKVEKFHTDFMAAQEGKGVTGCLFLVNRKAAVHLMEAPTAVLFAMLRSFREASKDNIYRNSRILSLTEEVQRLFPVWALRRLDDFGKMEFSKPKVWLPEIFDTLKGFLEMGQELAAMDEASATAYLQSTPVDELRKRVPGVEKIDGMTQCPDLCSVDEYLDIYDTPVEFTLEGELIWPVEPSLKY